MSVDDLSALILAVVGFLGWGSSVWLQRRGRDDAAKQQKAATDLAERAQAFEEVREFADRAVEEAERLRKALEQQEVAATRRLTWQGERCRNRLDELVSTVTALQGVVVSEMARASAHAAVKNAHEHVELDHPID